ncbi:circumsporozoite protein [Anastrepha obliqua]|uniref:circumsporozoite protein n=1 Tax=Anastrepha obliqua TaxID=95512 RepID=UPI0024092B7F|nr:circumsporozoite protein [Anastrepha obliqua]
MRQNLCCVLFLIVCLAVVLVKSETFTEIDEDGNEIEVKRFYIEGRQLNGGRRQCVESRRRKRSYQAAANDETKTDSYTAPSGIDTAISIDEEDDGNDEQPIGVGGLLGDNHNGNNKKQGMTEYNVDEDEDDESEEDEAVLSLPVVAQITHETGAQSSVAAASAASTGDNGIVIVQGNMPPKVNSQTHAVFELRPVENDNEDSSEGLEDEVDDYDDVLFEEEINPVSTFAIWSTGEDNSPLSYSGNNDDYVITRNEDDDIDIDDQTPIAKPTSKPKPKPKPKPSRKPTQKPSRKPANKPSKRPNANRSSKRPNTSTIKRRGSGNKNTKNTKRRPQSNKRGDNSETLNRKKHRPNNFNVKQNHLNKLDNSDKGENTYTRTITETRTGTPNDERDVNCIIINRTTSPRPFFGLFGRSANGDQDLNDKPYGRRKRINFSIPA